MVSSVSVGLAGNANARVDITSMATMTRSLYIAFMVYFRRVL